MFQKLVAIEPVSLVEEAEKNCMIMQRRLSCLQIFHVMTKRLSVVLVMQMQCW